MWGRMLALGGAVVLGACARESPPTAAEVKVAMKEVQVRGQAIAYRESGSESSPCVLLLHGAAFGSKTWDDLGTIALLARQGYRVVAVDLPGFADSRQAHADPTRFLGDLMDALALSRVAVVAPSMSGRFAFPLVSAHPERVSAFVPVAPAGLGAFRTALAGSPVPTLVFWGSQDHVFPPAGADEILAAMPNSQKAILAGAGHACYLDQPSAFHERLLAFLGSTSHGARTRGSRD
jgi:abhydrolase domain-containing protein 14